jgi:ribosome-binding protein aMBF1 (putative translation factor)
MPAVELSGEEIRRAREDAGISREELAVLVHRSAQTVYRWESGLAIPPPTVAGALRRLLDPNARRIAEIHDARVAAGLPPTIEDPRVLARVVSILEDGKEAGRE